MKWRCKTCGHEQPAHPKTTPEEMPLCDQPMLFGDWSGKGFYDHTGKWIGGGSCGGTFEKVETDIVPKL